MTATGNLSRGVVAEMCDLFTWPDFDKAGAFQFHKVINEPTFFPSFLFATLSKRAHFCVSTKGTSR